MGIGSRELEYLVEVISFRIYVGEGYINVLNLLAGMSGWVTGETHNVEIIFISLDWKNSSNLVTRIDG